jgi:uncharacterized protein YndB with AHSA1/START domain
MNKANINYVIYIATTPETLWQALTSPEQLKKYWGKIQSPWTVGSRVTEVDDSGKVLWKGEVRRSEPTRLLSFTMEVTGNAEPLTEVTFELSPPVSKVSPNAPVVRLTVTQTGFVEHSKLLPDCARAWPEILSSIKSCVETGRALGFAWHG